MKKYYSLFLAACLLAACDDWTEKNFDIENAATPENVIVKDYTLTEDDYSTIASLKINGIDKDALAAVKKNKYLTPATPADSVLPALMAKKYYTASEGTIITTTYLLAAESPEYLAKMEGATAYEVSAEDYAKVWGDEKTSYFTPAKSAAANLPAILKAGIADAADEDYATVSYKYSAAEPVGEGEEKGDFFEDFSGVVGDKDFDLAGWTNYTEKGTKRTWQGKSFDENNYVQFSANGSKEDENVAWLITPAINMSNYEAPKFTFDLKIGFYNAQCLQVLVSEDFADDPLKATWTDVTSNFYLPKTPTSGYASNFSVPGVMDMSAYTGKVNIAFKYVGSGNNKQTTTYQLDNIFVGDNVPVTESELFKEDFEGVTNNEDINLSGWTNYTEKGTKRTWQGKIYSNNGYAQFSANGSGEAENVAWLISPAITVPEKASPLFSFDVKVGYYKGDCLQILISKDFSDDPLKATWVDVTSNFELPQKPDNGYGDVFEVPGILGLGDYTGKINIAFKYVGSGTKSKTTTYQIDNIKVITYAAAQAKALSALTKATAVTETRYAFYQYDGKAWAEVKDAAIVNPADYTEMGASNPNFSATFAADKYLPAFMRLKFPYAQEGDVKTAVYHYYASSTTSVRADDYLYKAGEWIKNTVPVDSAVSRCLYKGGKWIVAPNAVFAQDFESVGSTSPADVPGWTAVSAKGNKWYTSLYNNNTYARCSGYGGGGVTEAWLITPAITLPEGYDLQFTFDCEVGYFTAPCLTVLISTDFAGDQAAATWTDITEHFALPTSPTSGYGKFENVGGFDLKEYLGKTIYIAFRLDGDSDGGKTTTYDIDNVSVGVVF